MMLPQAFFSLLLLPALAAAHFQLVFPTPRGTEDDGEATYPCAGFAQTQNRTSISTTAFPLAVKLGHTHSLISVFLALGNNAGNAFNYQLYPTVQETGPGNFCFPSVRMPSNLNITDGTNGTIQVVTDGEGGGGLYMCADVTFSASNGQSAPSCTNDTGLTAAFTTAGILANVSSTSTPSSSASSTAASASASHTNVAAANTVAVYGIIGAIFFSAMAIN